MISGAAGMVLAGIVHADGVAPTKEDLKCIDESSRPGRRNVLMTTVWSELIVGQIVHGPLDATM